jgi:flagellar biosynthesis protein FlhG
MRGPVLFVNGQGIYMYWGNKTVISIASGKGGVGKSIFAANLGTVLGTKGKRTILVDADVGAANLHTILGVKHPEKTLRDFIDNTESSIENVLLATAHANVRLLSSANEILSLIFPIYKERQRLLRSLQKLEADIIIFDIAAGTEQRATDFFSLAGIGIVIIEPLPTSIENAFSFLKNMVTRALLRNFYHDKEMSTLILDSMDPKKAGKVLLFSEILAECEKKSPAKIIAFREQVLNGFKRFYVVANSLNTSEQEKVAEEFRGVVQRYLSLDMHILGFLPFEAQMNSALIQQVPFVTKYPGSIFSRNLDAIADDLIAAKY